MPPADLDAAVAFLRAFARRRAARVVQVPDGFAVLDADYPMSYDHNKLIVTGGPAPAEILATADRVLGGAGLDHRQVVIDDDGHGMECAAAMRDAGYSHEINLVMFHTGEAGQRRARPALRVERVDAADLARSDEQEWRTRLPQADGETIRQLVRRRETLPRGADQVDFLAVRDSGSTVFSHADLYLDRETGIAQIEDLGTAPAYEGRGFAGAILADALRRATQAGCGRVFLIADAHDWPERWYRRLGFVPVGRVHVFTRWPERAARPKPANDAPARG